jgi:hypothetical protein
MSHSEEDTMGKHSAAPEPSALTDEELGWVLEQLHELVQLRNEVRKLREMGFRRRRTPASVRRPQSKPRGRSHLQLIPGGKEGA